MQSYSFAKVAHGGGYDDSFAPEERFPQPSWRSRYLKRPYQLGMLFILCAILATVESLAQYERRHGYLYVATIDTTDFSLGVTFLYKYLPTLIGVVFGLLWSLVDYDAKRLEPYFQLAKSTKSSAERALFMSYNFDLAIFIPIKALKQGYYSLALITFITFLTSWILTPLLSSIFTIQELQIEHQVQFSAVHGLAPQTALSSEFLYDSYATAWLGGSPPPYATLEYGVLPFTPMQDVDATTWKYNGTAFTANVHCVSARDEPPVYLEAYSGLAWTHPTRPSCVAGIIETDIFMYARASLCGNNTFVGMWNGSVAPGYPISGLETGPGLTNSSNAHASDILFCDITYVRLDALITYSVEAERVTHIVPHSTPKALSEQELNHGVFNSIIGGFMDYKLTTPSWPVGYDPPSRSRMQQYGINYGVIPPLNQGVGQSPRNVTDFTKENFIESVLIGHKALFAHAIPYLLNTSAENTTQYGTYQISTEAIVMVATFVHLFEACIIIMIALLTSIIIVRKPRSISKNPSSMAAVMSLIYNNNFVNAAFIEFKQVNKKASDLTNSTGGLRQYSDKSKHFLYSEVNVAGGKDHNVEAQVMLQQHNKSQSVKQSRLHTKESLPFILSRSGGVSFFVFVGLLFISLFVCYHYNIALNGLPVLSRKLFVQQLVYSYIPTGLAQIVGPLWKSTVNLLSLLYPFLKMRKGPCDAIQSILSTYTATPADFLFPKALRGGDIIIAITSIMPILSSLLTVSAGALFSPAPTNWTTAIDTTQILDPYIEAEYSVLSYNINPTSAQRELLNENAYVQSFIDGPVFGVSRVQETYAVSSFDHLQSLRERLIHGTLPTYTSDDHYYLPVDIPVDGMSFEMSSNNSYFFQFHTTGFKANLECESLAQPHIDVHSLYQDQSDRLSQYISVNLTLDGYINSTKIPLRLGRTFWWSGADSGEDLLLSSLDPFNNQTDGINLPVDTGTYAWIYTPFLAAAVEIPDGGNATASGPTPPQGPKYPMYEQYAQGQLMTGWLRVTPSNSTVINATFILCQQQLEAASFVITLDKTFRVQSEKTIQVSPYVNVYANDSTFFPNASESIRFRSAVTSLFIDVESVDTTLTTANSRSGPQTFLQYLAGVLSNNNVTFDPDSPLPPVEELIGNYSALYSRLFPHILGQNVDRIFRRSKSRATAHAALSYPTRRMVASKSAAIIAGTLLAINLVVILATFALGVRTAKFPKIPTNLASLLFYFDQSKALMDVENTEALSNRELDEHITSRGAFYSLGASGRDEMPRLIIQRH